MSESRQDKNLKEAVKYALSRYDRPIMTILTAVAAITLFYYKAEDTFKKVAKLEERVAIEEKATIIIQSSLEHQKETIDDIKEILVNMSRRTRRSDGR